jgi:hypothetical protein
MTISFRDGTKARGVRVVESCLGPEEERVIGRKKGSPQVAWSHLGRGGGKDRSRWPWMMERVPPQACESVNMEAPSCRGCLAFPKRLSRGPSNRCWSKLEIARSGPFLFLLPGPVDDSKVRYGSLRNGGQEGVLQTMTPPPQSMSLSTCQRG